MGTPIEECRPPKSRRGTVAEKFSLVRHENDRNGVQLKNYRKIKEASAEIAHLDERARKTNRHDPESKADWQITMHELRAAQRRLEALIAEREKHYRRALRIKRKAQEKKLKRKSRNERQHQEAKKRRELFDECEAAVIAEELDDAKRGL